MLRVQRARAARRPDRPREQLSWIRTFLIRGGAGQPERPLVASCWPGSKGHQASDTIGGTGTASGVGDGLGAGEEGEWAAAVSTDRMSALGSGCRSGAADNAMTCGDGIVGGTIARAVGGRGVRGDESH